MRRTTLITAMLLTITGMAFAEKVPQERVYEIAAKFFNTPSATMQVRRAQADMAVRPAHATGATMPSTVAMATVM